MLFYKATFFNSSVKGPSSVMVPTSSMILYIIYKGHIYVFFIIQSILDCGDLGVLFALLHLGLVRSKGWLFVGEKNSGKNDG